VKKFALRPTAKEFIPRSMMEEASEEVETLEVTIDSTGSSDSDRDAEASVDCTIEGADTGDAGVQSVPHSATDCDKGEQTAFVKVMEDMTALGCEEEVPKPDILDAAKVVVQPIEQKA